MLTMEHQVGLNPCSHTGQEGQAKVWGRGNKAGMVGLLGRSSGAEILVSYIVGWKLRKTETETETREALQRPDTTFMFMLIHMFMFMLKFQGSSRWR